MTKKCVYLARQRSMYTNKIRSVHVLVNNEAQKYMCIGFGLIFKIILL